MLKSVNNSVKKFNNMLKDPENMLIAILLVILVGLIIYYMRLTKNESYTGYEEYEDNLLDW